MSFSPVPCYIEPGIAGPYDCQELGLMWLDWAEACSPECIKRSELVLLVPREVQLPQSVRAWGKVTRINENSYISEYPQGANAVFKQVIWCQYHGKIQGPFLWVEPDCIPVKADWLDRIDEEYARWNKPFMGGIVEPIRDEARRVRVPRHMTGNAVYPDKCWEIAPKILEATHTPWDVLAAPQILPKAAETKLIQHEYRRKEISSFEELRRVLKPETALFHADKFGAIQKLLGNRGLLDIASTEPPEQKSTAVPENLGKVLVPDDGEKQTYGFTIEECRLEDILVEIRDRCESSKEVHTKIAKFMVQREIVTYGHLNYWKAKTNLLRRPRVRPNPVKDSGVQEVSSLEEIEQIMSQHADRSS